MVVLDLNLIGPGHVTIPAVLRSPINISDSLSWFTTWFPRMYDLSRNKIYEDSDWIVPKMWEETEAKGSKVLILDADGRIQGYVILDFEHKSRHKDKGTYVQFLASAPWNRKHSVDEREILNVGKVLVAASCLLAFTVNDTPVLELHSLPKAEGFYQKLGFRETGRVEDGEKEFRLEAEKGFELIRYIDQFLRKGE